METKHIRHNHREITCYTSFYNYAKPLSHLNCKLALCTSKSMNTSSNRRLSDARRFEASALVTWCSVRSARCCSRGVGERMTSMSVGIRASQLRGQSCRATLAIKTASCVAIWNHMLTLYVEICMCCAFLQI